MLRKLSRGREHKIHSLSRDVRSKSAQERDLLGALGNIEAESQSLAKQLNHQTRLAEEYKKTADFQKKHFGKVTESMRTKHRQLKKSSKSQVEQASQEVEHVRGHARRLSLELDSVRLASEQQVQSLVEQMSRMQNIGNAQLSSLTQQLDYVKTANFNQIQSLTEELNRTWNDSKAHIGKLQEEVKRGRGDRQYLVSQIEKLSAHTETQKQHLNHLVGTKHRAEELIDYLQGELSNSQRDASHYKTLQERANEGLNQFARANNLLQNEFSNLSRELQGYQFLYADALKQTEHWYDEFKDYEGRAEDATSMYNDEVQENLALRQELEDLQAQLEQMAPEDNLADPGDLQRAVFKANHAIKQFRTGLVAPSRELTDQLKSLSSLYGNPHVDQNLLPDQSYVRETVQMLEQAASIH
jgi:chromosome segregation ATPase